MSDPAPVQETCFGTCCGCTTGSASHDHCPWISTWNEIWSDCGSVTWNGSGDPWSGCDSCYPCLEILTWNDCRRGHNKVLEQTLSILTILTFASFHDNLQPVSASCHSTRQSQVFSRHSSYHHKLHTPLHYNTNKPHPKPINQKKTQLHKFFFSIFLTLHPHAVCGHLQMWSLPQTSWSPSSPIVPKREAICSTLQVRESWFLQATKSTFLQDIWPKNITFKTIFSTTRTSSRQHTSFTWWWASIRNIRHTQARPI